MKKAAILLCLCAAAVPAAAIAQSAGDDSLLPMRWTLKQPRKRLRTAQADPNMQGPKVPPPMRQAVPRAHPKQQQIARPPSNEKTYGAPLIAQMVNGRGRQ